MPPSPRSVPNFDATLENEEEIVYALLDAQATGQDEAAPDAWERFTEAALRDDRTSEVAFAFEGIAQGKRIRTYAPPVIAEFNFRAAVFFYDVLSDDFGARSYLERAVQANPAHERAFSRLTGELHKSGDRRRLAEVLGSAAKGAIPRERAADMLRQAGEIFLGLGDENDKAIAAFQEVLKHVPGDAVARRALEELYGKTGKVREIAKLVEQSLAADPPLAEDDALLAHSRLLDIYAKDLKEPALALPHVEAVLMVDPENADARAVAESLLGVRNFAARAAAILGNAGVASGNVEDQLRFLALELEHTRGARRRDLLKRLGTLRQENLSDYRGALEAFEGALLLDPSDDDTRVRYKELAVSLGTTLDAARTLIRVAPSVKEPAARARITVDTGELLALAGDKKRAKVTLASVLSVQGADEPTLLSAAYALVRLAEEDNDTKARLDMLERIATLERDSERREQATLALADIATAAGDKKRAAFAWKKLVGTSHRERALAALEPIFEDLRDYEELVFVIEERSKSADEPAEQRRLAFRAADILGGKLRDEARARAAWKEFFGRFGGARDAFAEYIPLLESAHEWEDLGRVLMQDAELADASEKPVLFGRLGLFHLQKTRNFEAAFVAFGEALTLDPSEPSCRSTVESLLASPDHRLRAAHVLEPIYRRDGDTKATLRVLEVRAEAEVDPESRLAALSEAAELAERDGLPKWIELTTRALGEAAASGLNVAYWKERADRAFAEANYPVRKRAELLSLAVGDRAATSRELATLVRAAAEAFEESGDAAEAARLYRVLLDADPKSTELLRKMDALLQGLGDPKQRVALFESTLAAGASPEKSRELLHTIGTIYRDEIKDTKKAIATFRTAYDLDAGDREAYAALLSLLKKTRAADALLALLSEHVEKGPQEDRRAAQLELALLARAKQPKVALQHARALVEGGAATAEELTALGAVEEALGDLAFTKLLFAERARTADSASGRAAWLSRLGDIASGEGDSAGAVTYFREAARAAKEDDDELGARKLLEKILAVAPDDDDARAALVDACEKLDDFAVVPALLATLIERAPTSALRVELNLRLARVYEGPLGDKPAALDAALRAFEANPDDEGARGTFARLASEQRAWEAFERAASAALAALRAAAEERTVAAVLATRADVLARSGAPYTQSAAALREALSAPSLTADDERALAELFGDVLTWEGATAQERTDDRRWFRAHRLERTSGADRVIVLLAWAREEEAEDASRALDLYRSVLALDEEHPDALAAVARLAAESGDVDAALAALRKQRERSEGAGRTSLDVDIARLLLDKKDDPAAALDTLGAAVDGAPNDPSVLALLNRLFAVPEVASQAVELVARAASGAEQMGDGQTQLALLDLLLGDVAGRAGDATARLGWHKKRIERAQVAGDRAREQAAALAAALEVPGELAFWERAEEIARETKSPDPVSDAYEDVIGRPLPRELIADLGVRAVEFHEEWYEDSRRKISLLERLFDANPQDPWAFDRLKLVFDAEERWDELFNLYDRAIARSDDAAKVGLLEDAAHVAKDFAKDTDRAISYFEAFARLKPGTRRIEGALERLYERTSRHRELIALYHGQLGALGPAEARSLSLTIATLYVDGLREAGPPMRILVQIIGDAPLEDDLVPLLEKVLAVSQRTDVFQHPTTEAWLSARQEAARILHVLYEGRSATADLARVLEVELEPLASTPALVAARRKLYETYLALSDDESAFRHARELVLLAPEAQGHVRDLEALARRMGRADALVSTLVAASERATDPEVRAALWLVAGSASDELLHERGKAIDHFFGVLETKGLADATRLDACLRLIPLLEAEGRTSDLLSILELRASLEEEPDARRLALAAAAKLAATQGDPERAIAAWEERVGRDPKDREALDALVDLYEDVGRNEDLVRALRARAGMGKKSPGARADRVRTALVLDERLQRPEESIEEWNAIERVFGETVDTKVALAGLYEKTGAFEALVRVLEEAAASAKGEKRAALKAWLGDVARVRLGDPERAKGAYAEALKIDAAQRDARRGLEELAMDAEHRKDAVDILLSAYERCDEFELRLALTEQRLAVAPNDEARVIVLLDAAKNAEDRASDLGAAFEYMRRAFLIAPWRDDVEKNLMRLADRADRNDACIDAQESALRNFEGLTEDDTWPLRVRFRLGTLLEDRARDDARALDAYARVATDAPADNDAALATIRVAARVRAYPRIAAVVLAGSSLDPTRIRAAEHHVEAHGSFRDLCDAVLAQIRSGDTEASLLIQAETLLARWLRDRVADAKASEAAFQRALLLAPRDVGLLRELAEVQRGIGGRPLVETLLALSAETGGDLALLREAAEAAGDDKDLAESTLRSLAEVAETQWIDRKDARGESYVRWAREELVLLYTGLERFASALETLVAGVKLPHKMDEHRALALRAAEVAEGGMGDVPRAVSLLNSLLSELPKDAEVQARLGTLYATHRMTAELADLRRHQIGVADDAATRAALRRELSPLEASLGDADGAVHTLEATLQELPRDAATVAALRARLSATADFEGLERLLSSQALLAEKDGDADAAVALYVDAAHVAERELSNMALAIKRLERAAALAPRPEVMDELARCAAQVGKHTIAVDQLERLRLLVPREERAAVYLRLADALVETGATDTAIGRLGALLVEIPEALDVRERLASLYRTRDAVRPLAELLAATADHVSEPAKTVPLLREAAELLVQRCADPASAIPLIRRAREVAPDDRALMLMLADALGQSGDIEGARTILREVLEGFGTRKPKERSTVHYYMGRLLLASGDRAQAITELETATKVDPTSATALLALAVTLRDDGRLDRAERAYRALLTVLRRPSGDEPFSVAKSEILLDLSDLARGQNDEERAEEILESAFEAAQESPFEAEQFERKLRQREAYRHLARALTARVQRFGDSRGTSSLELAAVLANHLDRAAEAWPYIERGLRSAPTAPGAFELAMLIAKKRGNEEELIKLLTLTAEEREDAGDRGTAAELYARVAELVAPTDLERAAQVLERTRELGASSDRVLTLLEDLYGRLGQTDRQLEVLEARISTTLDPEMRRQTLYRLSSLRMKREETVDQACDYLAEAAAGDPDKARYRELLRDGTDRFPANPRLVRMYEEAAREAGDLGTTLDALHKVWQLEPNDVSPLRDAVALARGASDLAAAERVLRGALDLLDAAYPKARAWALQELSKLKDETGDATTARELLRDAATLEEPEQRRELLFDVAARAEAQGDLGGASDIYAELLETEPTDPRAWKPLADIYRRTDRADKLAELLSAVAENETNPEERAKLRWERACLLESSGRPDDVVGRALLDVLDDDPGHEQAVAKLVVLYERTGQTQELGRVYAQLMDTARLRRDVPGVVGYARKLATMFLAEGRGADAEKTLRDALDSDPENKELWGLLVEQLRDGDPQDRAEALEKLIRLEQGKRAAELALELARLRADQWDDAAVERALELGFRGAPNDEELRSRLEASYRERGAWSKLAELYIQDATQRPTPEGKVERLRQAAILYADMLRDSRKAAATLREARNVRPDDPELLEDLIAALTASGELTSAVAELSATLDVMDPEAAGRPALLARRAHLRSTLGDATGAVADFEAAVRQGGAAAYGRDLVALLERNVAAAVAAGELEQLRALRLKLANLWAASEETERARTMVDELLATDGMDRDALHLLAWLEERAQRYDEAIATYRRIMSVERGDALVDAATRLADVCERAGRLLDAREGLERIRQMAPQNEPARQRLLRLYEETGQFRELADVSIELARITQDQEEKFEHLVRAGTFLLDMGTEPELALEPLEEALTMKPTDLDVVALLADTYTATGRTRDAAAVLSRTIAAHRGRRSRELGTLHHRLARVAQADGDRIGEVQSLTTALDMDPQNGVAASELAVAAMEVGQWDVASRALRAITMLKSDAPMPKAIAYQHLGEIAHQQGDQKRAVVMLKRAVDEDPGLQEARDLLQRLQT